MHYVNHWTKYKNEKSVGQKYRACYTAVYHAVIVIERSSVRPSVCLSCQSIAAAAAGVFAADVGREPEALSVDMRVA